MGISRQRKWQEENVAFGICQVCGKRNIFKNNMCRQCRLTNLMAQVMWKVKKINEGIFWSHGIKYEENKKTQ